MGPRARRTPTWMPEENFMPLQTSEGVILPVQGCVLYRLLPVLYLGNGLGIRPFVSRTKLPGISKRRNGFARGNFLQYVLHSSKAPRD